MRNLFGATAVAVAGLVLSAIGVIAPTAPARAASCFSTGVQTVTGGGIGTYQVNPDNWGGGDACVSTDGSADFTIQSQTVAGTGSVLAYPDIEAGCNNSGTGCTDGWTTEQVSALDAPTETWSTAGSTDPSAEYDVSNDIWFAPSLTACQDAELMIFTGGQNLAAPPATVVTISGVEYYFEQSIASNSTCTWNYIQFRQVSPVSSVTSLPLMPFFSYAESQGLLSSSDYLRQVAAGFELWSYGAGLQTTNFSVTE
jgi:hypothetical protein